MEELSKDQFDELLQTAPGSVIKLAVDDMLTILYAQDAFFTVVRNAADMNRAGKQVSLLRLVYSADVISVTQQIASQKNRKDETLRFHFRVLQTDGSFKWIQIAGKKMQETFHQGEKLVPVYSCLATDITEFMQQYKKLEQSADYHRVITELSRDLYFEYEIATDTLVFNEIFREIFGKESTMQGLRERLKKSKLIHQEELQAVNNIFNSMMNGRKQVRFELRMIPKDGKPCWYICYASIIFDENKTPIKVVGKLSTINQVEQQPEEVSYEPVLDSLTKVCNKESTERMIDQVMGKQEKDSLSALLLVEIRNYKNINEIRKTISGENILTTIGSILKGHFRTSDIIGRIGLSEFAILIKDLPTDHMAYDKAEQLCEVLASQYSYEHTKSGLQVSIGLTLQRGGQEYQTMLANANAALIMAKKIPNSSFEVFSGVMNG